MGALSKPRPKFFPFSEVFEIPYLKGVWVIFLKKILNRNFGEKRKKVAEPLFDCLWGRARTPPKDPYSGERGPPKFLSPPQNFPVLFPRGGFIFKNGVFLNCFI